MFDHMSLSRVKYHVPANEAILRSISNMNEKTGNIS